jgi:23S rRNA (adenine2503-C2)-methyltransferase
MLRTDCKRKLTCCGREVASFARAVTWELPIRLFGGYVVPNALGIKSYSSAQLRELLGSWGEPAFRAKQLVQWLYAQGATSYQEMTNLPKALRERLERAEPLTMPELCKQQVSRDGTRKYLLRLADGAYVETVGIPEENRLTVCFSTQVGCAIGCTFCATGTLGLTRSLGPGEMIDQLVVVAKDFKTRITNAVAMGEGEPFANYDATLAALRIMNSTDGLGIGARHLTVSSCGLIEPLKRFSTEPEQFTLAISLHSAVQATRDALMPALSNQPLDALRKGLISYRDKTGRRPSLEITLIDGITDTATEVAALIAYTQSLHCHVNLIALNNKQRDPTVKSPLLEKSEPFPSSRLTPSSPQRCKVIAAQLAKAGIECSIRRSRGLDIDGACGQLKGMLD